MAKEITITVGDLYAELHEQMLDGPIGEEYEQSVRKNIEDFIHEANRQVEQLKEEQEASAEELVLEEPEERAD